MNYDKYIGLPYLDNGRTQAGVDCWGLARLFYKDEFDIDLPSYSQDYIGGTDPHITEVIDLYKNNWEDTTTPNIGDLCLFNILGEPMHVGVYLGDNKFLHCRRGSDSVIESLSNIKWKNRFLGFYSYVPQSFIEAVGAPHPLKLSVYRDWTAEGTTVQDFVNFVKSKYTVSNELVSKIVIMIDGIVVPKSQWETTVVKSGQQLAYRSVAEGTSTKRLLITLAAVAITATTGMPAEVGSFISGGALTGTAAAVAGTVAIQMASMVLQNVIAPIRPPKTSDPGTAAGMNLFTGAANQANQYGAIPVVLGKIRFTGMLGSVPYVESLTETNVLNTAIIWGFGPLQVDDSTICIGSKPISDFYYNEPASVPRPVTLKGFPREYDAGGEADQFNNLYGRDVEQQAVNLELTNNATNITGSYLNTWKWQTVTLNQTCDAVDIVLSFPEGMRKINTKSGDIAATTCSVEIQMRPYSATTWSDSDTTSALGIYTVGQIGDLTNPAATFQLVPPVDPDSEYGSTLYRYTIFCINPSGGLVRLDGAVTDNLGANPSAWLQTKYANAAYSSLLGTNASQTYMPSIPPGYLPLYTFYQNNSGTYTLLTNHLTGYSGYTGLGWTDATQTIEIGTGQDVVWDTSAIKTISIAAGRVYSQSSGVDATSTEQVVWTTDTLKGTSGVATKTNGGKWSDFLKTYGIWSSTGYTTPAASGYGGTWTKLVENVTFPYTGYYIVEAAADDQGEILIDGVRAVQIPKSGYNNMISSIKGIIKLSAGPHNITIVGVDNQASDQGIGAKITYQANNGLNLAASSNTILTFGQGAWFEKRKDAFNWVHSVENLPRARYQVRVRRNNTDETEDEVDYKKYHKAILANVTGYDKLEKPMYNPPGCYLAKTAVRIQSSNKVNGQIDGINAVVHTIAWDYDRTTSSWENLRATNNPASLFAYVLMHPANAFRIKPAQLDLTSLTAWHNFCNPIPQTVATTAVQKGKYYTIKSLGTTSQADWNLLAGTSSIVYAVGDGFEVQITGGKSGTGTAEYCPKYTYNGVLSSTQSVMDTLRDICAAGLASPSYIDGKWGVIIDVERTHTVQHFTPHNSWGFESTKSLPILPHAFRINISDETQAYQAREIIVYNYGYAATATGGKKAAELFEQLTLPGVTNPDQAIRLARWHFAQIKLRPESYTINVDFEHLVCTRGDKVKISHDIPQWGVGSGRLGSGIGDTITGTTLTLREPVYLTSGTSYTILIRTNGLTSTTGSGSVTRIFTYSGTTGYTTSITVPTIASGDGVESDNLYMIGLSNTSVQECIVTAVEPSTNYSARLILVDYSPSIYTEDLSDLLTYNPNITSISTNIPLIRNSIVTTPIINSVISDSTVSDIKATGNIQNRAIASFTNPSGLEAVAARVQFDIIEGSIAIFPTNPGETYIIRKENSSITFEGLIAGAKYKIRARYLSEDSKIAGPWSQEYAFTNDGKNRNFSVPPVLAVDLENTYIVLDPTIVDQPSDFKAYAYRLYKDTGTTDLWDTTPVIPEVQSQGQGRLDLLSVPLPRISEAGINYRIACRVLDKTNNYSETSSYATILVRNIV
jgi:sulfur carrier protein ThiS